MPIARDRILFQDAHLLAVSKLGGELTVRGKGKLEKLPLYDFLKVEFPGLHPIHRLDFETSGVLVFAKSKKVLGDILATKFAGWRKEYLALVLGTPKPKGTVTFKLPARSGEGNVAAETAYELKEKLGPVSLVQLSFERGQRHQIRRHMAMIHHPLILDDVYGDKKANRKIGKFLKMQRFFLHASLVSFPHPVTGKEIVIRAELPQSFQSVLKKFRALLH